MIIQKFDPGVLSKPLLGCNVIHVTSMNRDKRALCMRRTRKSLDMNGSLDFDCYILGGT